jgi:hypothetical protein
MVVTMATSYAQMESLIPKNTMVKIFSNLDSWNQYLHEIVDTKGAILMDDEYLKASLSDQKERNAICEIANSCLNHTFDDKGHLSAIFDGILECFLNSGGAKEHYLTHTNRFGLLYSASHMQPISCLLTMTVEGYRAECITNLMVSFHENGYLNPPAAPASMVGSIPGQIIALGFINRTLESIGKHGMRQQSFAIPVEIGGEDVEEEFQIDNLDV